MINIYFDDYYALRDKTDKKTAEVTAYYADDIICRAGCASCCIPISLLPVEFHAIKKELENQNQPPGFSKKFPDSRDRGRMDKPDIKAASPEAGTLEPEPEKCIFLNNGICSIYSSRPIICRTQGLPLLYYSDELQNYTISVCSLNFTGKDDNFEFDTEYSIDLDRLNSSLYRINKSFLALNQHYPVSDAPGAAERIPLKTLFPWFDYWKDMINN
ncbi:MAG: YkgJ family cysteine cluster protein [Spirochaetia bacterium]|jgi:Fe-S-cluster containining protein|nr:YkgJ family cysteine cluster protein [Spirochaetia bacterium]